MNKNIYVIGHKSPDLDCVVAAVAYANFKNKKNKVTNYIPAIVSDVNLETRYLFEKTGVAEPMILENVSDEKLILVDHNEKIQSIDNVESAEIIEILDHHKVVFSGDSPIEFCVKPWGASCTIIADKYFRDNIEIDEKIAKLMLGAILVDTVISKSPTCTDKDIEIINKLTGICGISDWKDFGMEIFKIRSNVSMLSSLEIVKNDYKDFELKAGKFGIGQVETVSLDDFKDKESELLEELEKIKIEGDYHSVILFITDIINEGSLFLIASQEMGKIEEALGEKVDSNKVYIKGIVSRKKQVAPKFNKIFDK